MHFVRRFVELSFGQNLTEVSAVRIWHLVVPRRVQSHLRLEHWYERLVEVSRVVEAVLGTSNKHETVDFSEVCKLRWIHFANWEDECLDVPFRRELLNVFDYVEISFSCQSSNDYSKCLSIFALLNVVTSLHQEFRVHRLNFSHDVGFDVEEKPFLALYAHRDVEEGLVVVAYEDAKAVLSVLVVLDRPAKNVWFRSVFS